jgi:putative colanic acid biosysnthesis UDP-glucose lipid carrier transferase
MQTFISSSRDYNGFTVDKSLVRKYYSDNLLDVFQILAKRVFDLLVAGLFLIVIASWLFPLISILIKLDSKGPVIYKQLRGGQYEYPFYCLKFRTMEHNTSNGFKQAMKNDPRITKFGALLRKTSLDELPQIINVLIGEMSIVGPRPHAIEMDSYCSKKYKNYRLRYLVRPGITGMAQAKGFRGEIKLDFDMDSRIKLDLFYIKKWSFGIDIKIVLDTIKCLLLKNNNAY